MTKRGQVMFSCLWLLALLLMPKTSSAFLPQYSYVSLPNATRPSGLGGVPRVITTPMEVIIEGESFDLEEVNGVGGPIRYYFYHLMPCAKDDVRISAHEHENGQVCEWAKKNMPFKKHIVVIKASRPSQDETAAICRDRLESYRTEICRLHHEYARLGIDEGPLMKLCAKWREFANSKYHWKRLPNIGELSPLIAQGSDFDIAVQKAYEPIIDVKIANYIRWNEAHGVAADDIARQEEIAKLKRKVKKAERKAEAAATEAALARQEAEEAKREAQSAAACAAASARAEAIRALRRRGE